MWAIEAPPSKEIENSSSALEHRDYVVNAVAEMVAENAVTMLPLDEKPIVLIPLGVLPKMGTDKFRLTVNTKERNPLQEGM